MEDEIVQVCQAEIQGITVAVKATVQLAQWIFRFIRWLCTKEMEQRLNRPGCHSYSEVFKLSNGEMPQVLNIPDKDAQRLIDFAQKQNLHLALLPDLNMNDGKTQFAIPPQEAPLFVSFIKACAVKEKAEIDSTLKKYTTEEAELTEKLRHASGDTSELENQLEIIKERNRECGVRTEDVQKLIDEGGLCDLNEYLRTGKGSILDENLEKGMAAFEQGMNVSPKYSMKECMEPLRDPGNIPIEKFRFFIPDKGVAVTREYKVDAKTNICYSEYSFTTAEGEKCLFSDKGIPKEKWDKEQLPKIFEKIGCDGDTMARVFRSEKDREKFYKQYHDVIPDVVSRSKKKGKDAGNFSNAEVKEQLDLDKVENLKEKASADINSNNHIESYRVPVNCFYFNEGYAYAFDPSTGQKVCLGTKNDIIDLKPVGDDVNPGIAKFWEFSFDKNMPLACEDNFSGEKYNMSLDEGLKQGKFDFLDRKESSQKESTTKNIVENAQEIVTKGQSRHR